MDINENGETSATKEVRKRTTYNLCTRMKHIKACRLHMSNGGSLRSYTTKHKIGWASLSLWLKSEEEFWADAIVVNLGPGTRLWKNPIYLFLDIL